MKIRQVDQGFTLLEVLAAIAIVGLTIPALMSLMMTQADNAGSLRNKTIATWVAENTLTRLRLERQLSNTTLRDRLTENVTMAGVEWVVITEPEETGLGALLRYRTTVGFNEDEPLVKVDSFVH